MASLSFVVATANAARDAALNAAAQPAVKFTTVAEALKRPLNLGVQGGSVPVCANGICPSGSALMRDSIFQSRGHLGDEPTRSEALGRGDGKLRTSVPELVLIIGDVPEICRCGTRKRRHHLLKDEARRDHAYSGSGTL